MLKSNYSYLLLDFGPVSVAIKGIVEMSLLKAFLLFFSFPLFLKSSWKKKKTKKTNGIVLQHWELMNGH